MEKRYSLLGGSITTEEKKSSQARRKAGNGFSVETIPHGKTSLDLRLGNLPVEKWPFVYAWIKESLSSPAAFDGSSDKLQNKRIYAIAEFEGLMPKGFCRIHQTGEGKYSARKIGSIVSQEGIGRKVDVDWHTIQNQLERRSDFGYKEYVFYHPKIDTRSETKVGSECEVTYLEGNLSLWRKERGIRIMSTYGSFTETSAIKRLLGGLDINAKYF